MTSTTTQYTSLVTSQHADKADFFATVTVLVQPIADVSASVQALPTAFDLGVAVGAQLDVVGLWVGTKRQLDIALSGVYFALDTAGVGFDEGSWRQPTDPATTMYVLPDDAYRKLLRAKIAANSWDGTVTQATAIWNSVLADDGLRIVIQDNCDMTMLVGIIGSGTIDTVTRALISGGHLDLKPCGVHVNGHVIPTVVGVAFFGFDAQNSTIAGFDTGCWPEPI